MTLEHWPRALMHAEHVKEQMCQDNRTISNTDYSTQVKRKIINIPVKKQHQKKRQQATESQGMLT